ncbi:uncharacterized peroxidase-related enzyme [Parasphingorhabdus marina DSM 22363]|uniref:Uncharacterized peroxidase-related enzyme n=1 Tax=Parasphingorhabdus marina DSM 22363 TaxID=1123272 RepID=A0A1N6CMM1_9SPHN|nr:carboxymuconolactone decarboxylase family protein [Parasphingorhabdus marina]SIN59747.1 uncharacterized peroxidase-related enzyme [Parasphingorhabdus marina DSM 22363]
MTRIAPLSLEELPKETRKSLEYAQSIMGFTANDVLAMAHWPELLAAMEQLVGVIYKPGELDDVLKRMIGTIISGASGCRYCQAHTAHGAAKMAGGDAEKIAAVWDYQTSDLFDPAERAALDLALAAGQQPNAATDAHFRELEKYFSRQQIMEIMGVIGLFGFLNRWNDTLATELEDQPFDAARSLYSKDQWEAGKHRQDG